MEHENKLKRNARMIKIGNISIGGTSPIAVQSMLNFPSFDKENNVKQAILLEKAGCDIIRTAVPNFESVSLISKLKDTVKIPVVADIHFNYKLAIEAVAAGADKIRINPGNIDNSEHIKSILSACKLKNVPVRIGINSGSLKNFKKPNSIAVAMCENALKSIKLFENFDFENIVISLKSSSIRESVTAYRMLSKKCTYPFHIGITEAGTEKFGIIKSAIGIGALLLEGIGDTIRVSLAADPIREVEAGINILKSLELNSEGVTIISCPTCGRTRINVIELAQKLENIFKNHKKRLKIAVMGCAVNGPGEAMQADIGISGGNGIGIIFKNGKIIKKVPEKNLIAELIQEIKKM
jgi:(E)-4-hydroxy-3-methylbut-2-enyl-diphosphate synthase